MSRILYDTQYIQIVARLRDRRSQLGLTQSQAAQSARMTRNQIGKIERRETAVSLTQFVRICHTYGLRAYQLLREIEEG